MTGHKFEIRLQQDSQTQVLLDGQPVKCCGFKIEHHLKGVPTVTLTLVADAIHFEADKFDLAAPSIAPAPAKRRGREFL
jgi:hypothetical protein